MIPYTLYHWTHKDNSLDILLYGLLIEKATTKKKRVYAVAQGRVSWARGHVAERHGWNVDDLHLFTLHTRSTIWRASAAFGVFFALHDVGPWTLAYIRRSIQGPQESTPSWGD